MQTQNATSAEIGKVLLHIQIKAIFFQFSFCGLENILKMHKFLKSRTKVPGGTT